MENIISDEQPAIFILYQFIAIFEDALGKRQLLRSMVDEERAFHEFASIKPRKNYLASKIEMLSSKVLAVYDPFFRGVIGCHFFALAGALVGGCESASRASRSAFRRSRFFENAFCAISCSAIAISASTWRNALRASRSALLIGFCGSTSPGVFVISSPSAPALQAGGWLATEGADPFATSPNAQRWPARPLASGWLRQDRGP
jgi:hypothetical protein